MVEQHEMGIARHGTITNWLCKAWPSSLARNENLNRLSKYGTNAQCPYNKLRLLFAIGTFDLEQNPKLIPIVKKLNQYFILTLYWCQSLDQEAI